MTTTSAPTGRPLTLRQICCSIVLDLRSQDLADTERIERDALSQIRGWREAAVQAGDRPVFQAIDYLGEDASADTYARGGHLRRFTGADVLRLERWWTRRFAAE